MLGYSFVGCIKILFIRYPHSQLCLHLLQKNGCFTLAKCFGQLENYSLHVYYEYIVYIHCKRAP